MGDDPIGPRPNDSNKLSASPLLPSAMALLPSVMQLLMIAFNIRSVLVATACFVLSVVTCLMSSIDAVPSDEDLIDRCCTRVIRPDGNWILLAGILPGGQFEKETTGPCEWKIAQNNLGLQWENHPASWRSSLGYCRWLFLLRKFFSYI